MVRLDRLLLGRTDIKGTVRLPRSAPIQVDMIGVSLDLSALLAEKTPKQKSGKPASPPGPMVSARARVSTIYLAREQVARNVSVSGEYDGKLLQGLALTGVTGNGKPFSAEISRGRPGRHLVISAAEVEPLLNGLDVTDTIREGSLVLTGAFDDSTPLHTFSGTIDLSDFHVTRAVILGKLLQTLTFYGLVDALSGPGLRFARLIAPFQYDEEMVTLTNARAFSASLGITARGQIDLPGERLSLDGTVVPVYVFNSLLGRIPLLGRLFSGEEGGGLIAMNFSISGPTDDPSVRANPLSALTPGVLRRMFDVFDQPLDRAGAGGKVQAP